MSGTGFCPGCGASTTPLAEICVKCGAKVTGKAAATGSTWMPVIAGILDLVIGVPNLIIGIIWATVGGLAFSFTGWLGALIGGPMIILSIVAIVGGVFALRKRAWGFALAAAICAFIGAFMVGLPFMVPAILLGIPAIVFTILGKEKFK